jgi:hypothetical protein
MYLEIAFVSGQCAQRLVVVRNVNLLGWRQSALLYSRRDLRCYSSNYPHLSNFRRPREGRRVSLWRPGATKLRTGP